MARNPGDSQEERQKWDRYYSSITTLEADPLTTAFNEEFADLVSELIAPGSPVLEAGCGGGWQSQSLARRGFRPSLMDFSREALAYSRRIFESQGLAASFELRDVLQPGEPNFELVFNAGVLEHYSFDEQVEFLRGMASRSTRFVIALVPNRRCYWYWIWRLQTASKGEWAWGHEAPMEDLSAQFRAAGLNFIGQRYVGRSWTEHFIRTTAVDEQLQGTLLDVHRSGVIAPEQSSYLLGALGSVEGCGNAVATGWTSPDRVAPFEHAELTAALADSLVARQTAEQEIAVLRKEKESADRDLVEVRSEFERWRAKAEAIRVETIESLRVFNGRFEADAAGYRNQRAWQVMLLIRKVYGHLFQEGWAGRAALLRFLLRLPIDGIPSLAPYDLRYASVLSTVPAALAKSLLDPGFEAPAGGPGQAAASRTSPERYDVVVLPVFEFDFRYQRPQQLAAQFGANGHRVFWVSPSRRPAPKSDAPFELAPVATNVWEVRLQQSGWDIYQGALTQRDVGSAMSGLKELYRREGIGPSVAIVQLPFWRRLGLALRAEQGAQLLFDCMDDWGSFPEIGEFNRSEQEQLLTEADVLTVTGERLRQRCLDFGCSPLLVRNAVDFQFFSSPRGTYHPLGVPGPVVGYVGAIADWFDYELLNRVAALRPNYSFVLVGGLGLEEDLAAEVAARFESIPNIYLLGHRPYQEVPQLIAQFDVCIIPFVLNAVTEATDPVKLYEYFSLGKPVVATEMAELAQCPDLLYRASDPAVFAACLDEALSENQELRGRRVAFATENTWLARYRVIDEAVQKSQELVSVILVCHNSAEYLPLCLESLLRKTSYPNFEVIAIDNGSEDDSVRILRSYAERDDRIRLELLDKNVGFARANNLAVKSARGRYFVLLNADTMLTSNWLWTLLRHARSAPDLGMVLPVTNWAGNEVRIDVDYQDLASMHDFASDRARSFSGCTYPLEVGPLFCALIPRSVWDQIGGLDERFTTGMFEDDDYSLRLRDAGFRIIAAEDCFVHHFGSGSFGQLSTGRYEEIFRENLRRFEDKWGRRWQPHSPRPGVREHPLRYSPTDSSWLVSPSE